MNSFAELRRAVRRRDILRLAAEAGRFGCSEELIALGLQGRGIGAARDAIAVDLSWLEEQGLVRIEQSAGERVVIVTQRGDDVCRGLAQVPGVARPGLGD